MKKNQHLNSVSEDDIKKQGGKKATLSCLVGMTGFEPATPSSRTKYATGLRYIPLIPLWGGKIIKNQQIYYI